MEKGVPQVFLDTGGGAWEGEWVVVEMIENFVEDCCQTWPVVAEGSLEVFFLFCKAFYCWGDKQE